MVAGTGNKRPLSSVPEGGSLRARLNFEEATARPAPLQVAAAWAAWAVAIPSRDSGVESRPWKMAVCPK